jgi:hypothetical protein
MGQRLQFCNQDGCPTHQPHHGGGKPITPEQAEKEKAKQKEQRKKLLAQVAIQRRYRSALIDAIGTALVPESVLSDFVTETCAKIIGGLYSPYNKRFSQALKWDEKVLGHGGRESLRKKLDSMRPVERLRAAMIVMHYGEMSVSEFSVSTKPTDMERIAKAIGVDIKPLWDGAQKKPEKVKASKAPKAQSQTPAAAKSADKPSPNPKPKKQPIKKPKAVAKKATAKGKK